MRRVEDELGMVFGDPWRRPAPRADWHRAYREFEHRYGLDPARLPPPVAVPDWT